MPKIVTRIVALLLIPCLIADPVSASAWNGKREPASSALVLHFQDQALVGAMVLFLTPFQKSAQWVRRQTHELRTEWEIVVPSLTDSAGLTSRNFLPILKDTVTSAIRVIDRV